MLFNRTLFFLCLAVYLPYGCNKGKTETASNAAADSFWTDAKNRQRLLDREDSTKWDMEMFANDTANMHQETQLPISNGVFPVPFYDLAGKGSFKGLGNYGLPGGPGMEKKSGNKTVLYNSFFVNRSDVNRDYTGEGKNEIFFQIIVLTDFVDTVDYSHLKSEIVSRNHPDYVGQGFYITRNSKITYTAFITAGRDAYAIINMRLFDLTRGKTIVIAPRKDGTFRSMQVKSPALSSETIDSYTDKLLKEPAIMRFLQAPGNI